MSKHTEGPWFPQTIYGKKTERYVYSGPRGPIICVMPPDPKEFEEYGDQYGKQWAARSVEELVANMQLTAAAPDLLAALKEMVPDQHDFGTHRTCTVTLPTEIWNEAMAAIARAEGD